MIDSLSRALRRAAPTASEAARRLRDPDDSTTPMVLWGTAALLAVAVAVAALRYIPAPAAIPAAAPTTLPPAAAPATVADAGGLRELVDTYRNEAASLLRLATTLRQDNDLLRGRLLAVETEIAGLNANSILKGRIERVEDDVAVLHEQTTAAAARVEAIASRASELDRTTTAAIPTPEAAAPAEAVALAAPAAAAVPAATASPVRVVGPATAFTAGPPATVADATVRGAVLAAVAADDRAAAGAIPPADAAALPSPLAALPGPAGLDLLPPVGDLDAGLGPRRGRTFTGPEGPIPLPAPRPADRAGAGTTRSQFGLDLGAARDIPAARLFWTGLVRAQGPLVAQLQPIAAMRREADGTQSLRVILGPFGDAADAASACARLQTAGVPCTPTLFDGAPLAP